MLKRFMIERAIDGVGAMDDGELGAAAATSNAALATLDGVQWQHSYVAKDKTFCVYLARSEALIREHARLSGFPATTITEITAIFDPATERKAAEQSAA